MLRCEALPPSTSCRAFAVHAALLVLTAAALRLPPADTMPGALACDSAALRTPLGSATDTVVLRLRPADGSSTRLPSP